MMKPIFTELEKEYDGKVGFKVINVDEQPELSSQHHVLGIPTYIIMKEGQEVDRLVGFTPRPTFVAKLNNYV